jgi:hypothetical protein
MNTHIPNRSLIAGAGALMQMALGTVMRVEDGHPSIFREDQALPIKTPVMNTSAPPSPT